MENKTHRIERNKEFDALQTDREAYIAEWQSILDIAGEGDKFEYFTETTDKDIIGAVSLDKHQMQLHIDSMIEVDENFDKFATQLLHKLPKKPDVN